MAISRVGLVFGALLLTVVSCGNVDRSTLDSSTLLRKTLQYHDPHDQWDSARHQLVLRETGSGGRDRTTTIVFDAPNEHFSLRSLRDGNEVIAVLEAGACSARVNGSAQISPELMEKYRLSCDGIRWWRDYYGYLYGLPMKLNDPGTLMDSSPEQVEFQGETVWAVRVTYSEEVGRDIWYFYFDPGDFSLVGCRFFHEEAANDGEYIVFEDEVERGGLRLPKTRRWYTNSEQRFLGTDEIIGEGD